MNDTLFKEDNFTTFNFKELDGKILKIIVREVDGICIVMGYDIETKVSYVLHCNVFNYE